MNYRRGFTIVELLVVIIVIGILASISIVAYTGIQTRAHNAQLLSAFDTYEKALRQYKIFNGAYPIDPSGGYACLGNFNPKPPLTTSTCFVSGGMPVAQPSNTVNAALATIISSSPSTNYQINFTNDLAVGGILYYAYSNGANAQIIYYIKDNQECGRGLKGTSTQDGIPFKNCIVMLN